MTKNKICGIYKITKSAAELATGVDKSQISKCIKGEYKKAGGYLWR